MDAASSHRLRLTMIAVVAVSLFGALFARMWYLQVMVAGKYQLQASADRVRTVQVDAPRGLILDDKGRVLVKNRTSLVVTMDPVVLDTLTKAQTADLEMRVATELTNSGVPTKVTDIAKALVDKNVNHLQPIPVAIDVPTPVYQYFAERSSDFPGVGVEREAVRDYPNGSLAANVLGYVSRINDQEIIAKQGGLVPTRKVPKPYQPDSDIGKTGVEATYEDYLRGTPGIKRIEVDAENKPVRVISETPPIPGDDVELSIDIDAQSSAETALAQQLTELRGTRESGTHQIIKSPAGSVVALNPTNGAVIAMATYPTYNPSDFVNGISSDEYAQLTGNGDANNPLINRATQGQYAPGSTFKLITATAALQRGIITATTPWNDTGVYHASGCRSGCDFANAGRERLGTISLPTAITESSDTYFYHLGDVFWHLPNQDSALVDTGRAYGLAQPTGVPLGGESIGFLPDRATTTARHQAAPKAFPKGDWQLGDNIHAATGQGDVLVTPLQLANAYATFANGGTVYQPQVVARILKPGGNPADPKDVISTTKPVVKGHVDLPPQFYNPMLQGFVGAVSSPHGTAYAAFKGFNLSAVPIGGKTGTAQVQGKADTSLFASFGPVGNVQYTIVAVLEQSGFGADAAAPVVRHVWETVTGQAPTQVAPEQTGIVG